MDRLLFHETEKIARLADSLKGRLGGKVRAAVVLGSGFTPLVELLQDASRVSFAEIDGLARCRAPGHSGVLVGGTVGGARVALFSGRLHLYEGCSAGEVALPVAIAAALGADRILLTSAAGATSDALAPGDLLLVEDHLNLTGANPLLEIPIEKREPAFLSLGDAYDPGALDLAERLAASLPGGVRRGVLASLPGPSFETPAEYRALSRLGADVVSMSCVLETIAARALGLRVLAMALVANGPARLGEPGADGGEVLRIVERAVRSRLDYFERLLTEFAAL